MNQEDLRFNISELDRSLKDPNKMLRLEGLFRLKDVCRLIIFTPRQIRDESKRYVDPQAEMGVFFHKPVNAYLVDMPIFLKMANRALAQNLIHGAFQHT